MAIVFIVWGSSFITFFFLLLMIGIGLFWAPVAALICGLMARSRGMSVRLYALAGGLYSMMLFLPWFYLVVRMSDRRSPQVMVKSAYVLAYLGWVLGPIILSIFFLSMKASGYEGFGPFYDSLFWDILLLILNLGTLIGSLKWLQTSHENFQKDPQVNSANSLPRVVYLMPFGLATLWTLLVFVGEFALPHLAEWQEGR